MNAGIRTVAAGMGSAVLAMASVASASQISIKLFSTPDTGIDSSGAAGVVRQTGNWNNLGTTGTSSATFANLVDNTGYNYGSGATAPTIAVSAAYFSTGPGGGFSGPGSTTEDNQLFTGSVGTNGSDSPNTVTLTLSNVPYANYNLYVYYGGSSSQAWEVQDSGTGLNYWVKGDYGTTGGYALGTAQTSGSAVAANYVIFSESSANDVLTFPTTADGTYNLAVFGLQIVQTPEPGSLALLGVAGACGLLRRGKATTG